MVCMAAAMVAMMPSAQAQVPIAKVGTFSGVPAAVTNNTTTTLASTNGIVELRKNQGLVILPTFAATAATTSNLVFRLDVSADNITYTTTAPLQYHVAMNGTNVITAYKLFPPSELNNVRYVRLTSVQNNAATGGGGAGVLISNVQYSFFNP